MLDGILIALGWIAFTIVGGYLVVTFDKWKKEMDADEKKEKGGENDVQN